MNSNRTIRIPIKLLGLLALATSGAVLAADKGDLNYDNIQVINLNRSVNVGTGGESQQVFIDSETKKIRQPNAEELQENAKRDTQKAKRSATITKASKTASGAWTVRLSDEHQPYSVAKRNADGSLTAHCIEGKASAEKSLSDTLVSHKHTHAGAHHD